MKDKITPLYALSRAVCKDKGTQLFNNQVVMYQLLIPFMSDPLISFSNSYPHATYELAAGTSNPSERARLIALCQQQLYSAKQLDTVLLNELEDLKGTAP